MRATAVVPIKRFDAAKQRLSDALPPGDRARLAAAMAADVLDVLSGCEAIERVIVVSGEPEVAALAARAGVEIVEDADDAGHSEAALIGVAAAEAGGASCVVLLPGDCPLLDAAELAATVDLHQAGSVAVIPDRHGAGTNGLVLSPPSVIAPAFGPGSRERHEQLAAAAGAESRIAEVPSMGLDLDTADDLDELYTRAAMAGHSAAPRTTAVLALLTAGSQ